MKIKITWEINDGYAGKSRPQHSIFNSKDYMDEDEWVDCSNQKQEEYINEFIQEEFCNKISWSETSREIIKNVS